MSAQSEKTVIPIAQAGDKDQTKSVDILGSRATPELIVAFMGAVGCGLASIITEFENQLQKRDYKVIRIKLSEFIKEQVKAGAISIPDSEKSVQYLANQTGGNLLRQNHSNEVLAQYAINQISRHRLTIDPECPALDKEPPRVAYLIDQIKHPEEVELFRMVYRNVFYLIGVMSIQEHRESRLSDEGLNKEKIKLIITRDRKESEKFGQQLEKAFKLADYFMHHPLGDQKKLIPEQTTRFINLMHGHNGITPTKHEHAMYVAHSTALKSSCLSRQVGAVITDKTDRIIAVGTNDVPKYGGGLYTAECGTKDDRCYNHRRVCENVTQKMQRKKQIRNGIETKLPDIFPTKKVQDAVKAKIDEIVELVFSESGIPDLIEFSRAVHAEMDAFVSLARGGGGATIGGNLYTTTFPCHNCARHIVAAGIEKVYYIEPYEKSLALEAHSDSIQILDHEDNPEGPPLGKVKFIHFSGVAPRLYSYLFLREGGRKGDDGKLIEYSSKLQDSPDRIIKEYIDSYRTFEMKIASIFVEEFPVH